MKILVTGCNGYIGNAITQRLLFKGYYVIGIDNDIKINNWANSIGVESAMPIFSMDDKFSIFNKVGRFEFHCLDIVKDIREIEHIFKYNNIDTIINLAQQPSALFSQIGLHCATTTIVNNTIGTLNLLWLMKDWCPGAHFIEIESMGTIQPDINVNIPEGNFIFDFDGKRSLPSLFPRRPASFYHSSKVNTTYIADAVHRWWGMKITSINQGVVYGCYTPEIEETKIYSPFWYDRFFGTVVNRFVVQALCKKPLTVYGKGKHKRGFLSLNDSVQCLELFVDNSPEQPEFRNPNQLDERLSINDVADKILDVIPGTKKHVDSYRIENTEDFYYNPISDIIENLGYKRTRDIETEVLYMANFLKDIKFKNHYLELFW
jgi:nucleoside-diphosphate-sugar epimerase